MTRNHEPKVSGHALLKERKVDNNEIEFAEKEKGYRTLYGLWKPLDDRLEILAGKKTYMNSLEDLCRELQSFVDDFTILLEEKPKLRALRRRPKFTEIELMSQRKRIMSSGASPRVREAMLAKMGEAYFCDPAQGHEGNY